MLQEVEDKLLEVLHKAHKVDMEKLGYLGCQENKAKVEIVEYLVPLEGKVKEVLQELEDLMVHLAMLKDVEVNKGNRVLLVLKVSRVNVKLLRAAHLDTKVIKDGQDLMAPEVPKVAKDPEDIQEKLGLEVYQVQGGRKVNLQL